MCVGFRRPEPTTPHSIDALRDGASFPGSCGKGRDIGVVLEIVNGPAVA